MPVEARDKALKQTAELLRKIDEVRKQLELPVDQLPVVTDGEVFEATLVGMSTDF